MQDIEDTIGNEHMKKSTNEFSNEKQSTKSHQQKSSVSTDGTKKSLKENFLGDAVHSEQGENTEISPTREGSIWTNDYEADDEDCIQSSSQSASAQELQPIKTLVENSSRKVRQKNNPAPNSVQITGDSIINKKEDSGKLELHNNNSLKSLKLACVDAVTVESIHRIPNVSTKQIDSPLSESLTNDDMILLQKLELQNKIIKSDPKSLEVLKNNISQTTMDSKLDDLFPVESNSIGKDEDKDNVEWDFWGKFLSDFEGTLKKNNKGLIKKVQNGLPKFLRGSIWYHLSKNHPVSFLKLDPSEVSFKPPEAFSSLSLEASYVELLKLSSTHEKMITRDLARTFPKLEFFKNPYGSGQESLFNVMKAYSLYDSEVGYCQGLSFIAGTLLLHVYKYLI